VAGFVGDECVVCGGIFNWGGDARKVEHSAWHGYLVLPGRPETYHPEHEFHSWARSGRDPKFDGARADEYVAYLAGGGRRHAEKLQRNEEIEFGREHVKRAGATAPTIEGLFRHAIAYGPEEVGETARTYLQTDELVKLAARVNQVIAAASRPKQDGEPRAVTSYRARIAEARTQGSHAVYLALIDTSEAGLDPRVQLTLDLHAQSEKTAIIAGRVGRSTEWVRKTIRAAATTPGAE
jgi:hypothetical protein